jgi:hypothetical protein
LRAKVQIKKKEKMKKLKSLIMSATAFLVFAAPAFAVTDITINMYPEMATNVIGVADDHAPDYSLGSFAADGSGKTDMYFTPTALFEKDITLDDIESISYWTKKGENHVANPAD